MVYNRKLVCAGLPLDSPHSAYENMCEHPVHLAPESAAQGQTMCEEKSGDNGVIIRMLRYPTHEALIKLTDKHVYISCP